MNIAQLRLNNQRLSAAEFRTPEAAVAWLGAVQAQDYAGAKWSIGVRMSQGTDDAVEKAIGRGKIVRTWPMRGTLHFVAANDIRWMLSLLAARQVSRYQARDTARGLDEARVDRCRCFVRKLLQGGKRATRDQLRAAMEEKRILGEGHGAYHVMRRLAHEGLVCFGPRIGKQHSVVLLEEWVAPAKPISRDQALARLAQRYFQSHGPATLADFVWWSGLTMGDARAAIAGLGKEFVAGSEGDVRYWQRRSRRGLSAASARLCLLPAFDEYLVGYRDRSAVLEPRYAKRICPGGNGIFCPTIVSKGHVVGTWKRNSGKGRLVEPRPFSGLSSGEERAFVIATERYRRFLRAPS